MRRMYRAIRQARPDAWLAAVLVACVFAGGSERRSTSADEPSRAADVVQVRSAATGVEADGQQRVRLAFDIAADWHLYANPVDNEQLADSVTVVKFRSGDRDVEAQVEYPAGADAYQSGIGAYKVYQGQVTIMATVKRADASTPLTAHIAVQACNDKKMTCLPPATLVVPVP
jgi:DsbC/DsbD-like thiol-disulfide interchange protein